MSAAKSYLLRNGRKGRIDLGKVEGVQKGAPLRLSPPEAAKSILAWRSRKAALEAAKAPGRELAALGEEPWPTEIPLTREEAEALVKNPHAREMLERKELLLQEDRPDGDALRGLI